MGADHRLVEMNKAVYEFERDIIRGAVNAVSRVSHTVPYNAHYYSALVPFSAREC